MATAREANMQRPEDLLSLVQDLAVAFAGERGSVQIVAVQDQQILITDRQTWATTLVHIPERKAMVFLH